MVSCEAAEGFGVLGCMLRVVRASCREDCWLPCCFVYWDVDRAMRAAECECCRVGCSEPQLHWHICALFQVVAIFCQSVSFVFKCHNQCSVAAQCDCWMLWRTRFPSVISATRCHVPCYQSAILSTYLLPCEVMMTQPPATALYISLYTSTIGFSLIRECASR